MRATAIVEDLAAIETPFDDLDCVLCGVYRYRLVDDPGDHLETAPAEHEDRCPYRRAVEWVKGL